MIFQQLKHQLEQLNRLISNLSPSQYTQKITHLENSSIGAHSRHIIELLQCANNGYLNGSIDYINRKRALNLETNLNAAKSAINELIIGLEKADKSLNLLVEEFDNCPVLPVSTTYFREIVYNTEHTIHHLALIKVALIEMNLQLVDANFGMAYSTIKYKASLLKGVQV